MTPYNRIIRSSFLAATMLGLLVAGSAHGQVPWSSNNYPGILEYGFPFLRTLPAVNTSQPVDIQTDYLLLDDAFREIKPGFAMDNYIKSLSYNDTLKYISSLLYRVVDDNPITFIRWCSASTKPYPYKANPGRERNVLQQHLLKVAGDTGKTFFLQSSDYILDLKVTDTSINYCPSDNTIKAMVLAKCEILDGMKGKYVPACPDIYKSKSKGVQPASIAPVIVDTVPTTPGTCTEFEYCPRWGPGVGGDEPPYILTNDSTKWNWIQKDSEYIVFLCFQGIWADSSNAYLNLATNWGAFGTQTAMYAVRNGRVVDPKDDFHMGAGIPGGLAVADWKSRLRAKINTIVNP